MPANPQNPLEGVTLEKILTELVDYYGWDELGRKFQLNCFTNNPSLKSSLTFLRRAPWARAKVERLYLTLHGVGTAGMDTGKRRTRKPPKE